MVWDYFIYIALAAILLWIWGAWAAWKKKRGMAIVTTILGLVIFFGFILSLWYTVGHPPLRTLGETRLWYSLFLPLVGLVVYIRWRYSWILSFSTLMATVFICVNIFRPEIHDKTLMPALQSPWFAPHVIVYMFAYALLGAATLVALWKLFAKKAPLSASMRGEMAGTSKDESLPIMGETEGALVRIGFSFLTLGMLFGALWAKEAWGHYWSWDPKETWAAITWFSYLIYIHYKRLPSHNSRTALWMLIVSFLLLQMCWWGINYLPSAIESSVHTYGR